MKKIIIICMILALIFAFAACDNSTPTTTNESASILDQYETLSNLPEYCGTGEITVPWEEKTSGFYIKGATIDDMTAYGNLLKQNGWTHNTAVSDYNPTCLLYYTDADNTEALQLKLINNQYIRLALGDSNIIEGLQ